MATICSIFWGVLQEMREHPYPAEGAGNKTFLAKASVGLVDIDFCTQASIALLATD